MANTSGPYCHRATLVFTDATCENVQPWISELMKLWEEWFAVSNYANDLLMRNGPTKDEMTERYIKLCAKLNEGPFKHFHERTDIPQNDIPENTHSCDYTWSLYLLFQFVQAKTAVVKFYGFEAAWKAGEAYKPTEQAPVAAPVAAPAAAPKAAGQPGNTLWSQFAALFRGTPKRPGPTPPDEMHPL